MATLSEGEARTVLGESGRPERTEYSDGSTETYEYDGDGRLVAIEESSRLWSWCSNSERLDTGGRLSVLYAGADVDRILDGGGVVWARPSVPWEQRLPMAAVGIAELVTAELDRACPEVDDAVSAVCLTYVDQGSLQPMLNVGFEAGRRRVVETFADVEARTNELLYLYPDGVTAGFDDLLECALPDDLDRDLLREASMAQPDDPYRVVLGAAARVISERGLGPRVSLTDDFVVYVAEHDEGVEAKFDSIRSHNTPERVARWAAAWRGEPPPDSRVR